MPVYRAEWRGQISTFPPVGTAPPAMPVRYSSRHPLFTGRHPLASQSTCPVAVTACCAEVGAANAVVVPPKTASKITALVAKKRLNIASSCQGLIVLIRCHLRLQGKRGQDVTAAVRTKPTKPSAPSVAARSCRLQNRRTRTVGMDVLNLILVLAEKLRSAGAAA